MLSCLVILLCTSAAAYVLWGTAFTKDPIERISWNIRFHPFNPSNYLIRGRVYLKMGESRNAIADFNKAIELNPRDIMAYVWRSSAFSELGLYKEAVADANKAIEMDPHVHQAFIHRGIAFVGLRQYGSAINDYKRALELNPRDVHGNNHVAYLNLGTVYFKQGQVENALSALNQAIALDPDDRLAEMESGQPYSARAMVRNSLAQYDSAVSDATRAIELAPDNITAHMELARAYIELKKPELALTWLNKALNKHLEYGDHIGSTYHLRGLAYASLGKFDQAVKDYDRLIELQPDNAHAYYLRGVVEVFLGQNAKADSDLQKHLQLTKWKDDHAPYAALFGAIALRRLGEREEAEELLSACRRNLKEGKWPLPICETLKGDSSAAELFKVAKDNVDRLTEAHAFVGADLAAANKRKEAIPHLQWVVQNGNKSFSEYQLADSLLRDKKQNH